MDFIGLVLCLYLELFKLAQSGAVEPGTIPKKSGAELASILPSLPIVTLPCLTPIPSGHDLFISYVYLLFSYSFSKYVQHTSYVLGTLLFAGDIAVPITNMVPPFLVRKDGVKQLIMW